MALVFQPHDIIWVPAPAHSPTHEYRVAFGYETWDPNQPPIACLKVQMADGKKVLGRQAPSYPNKVEYRAVMDALDTLFNKHSNSLP